MWLDVYTYEGDTLVFRQRVERPDTPEARHALHLEMCQHLSDSPMNPLPMDGVVLKEYPPPSASTDSASPPPSKTDADTAHPVTGMGRLLL